jgi:hypothetical protein
MAGARQTITYADFAFTLGLGSPRRLGWLLTPLFEWCRENGHPPLPIIVVRRADGLPSGGYDSATVAAETERVFDHPWSEVAPPDAAGLARFALPHLPPGLRGRTVHDGAHPC